MLVEGVSGASTIRLNTTVLLNMSFLVTEAAEAVPTVNSAPSPFWPTMIAFVV